MVAVLGDGAPARGPARKALRDLRWRQRQTGRATYVLSLDAATTLDLGQNVRGEVDGTGTGGTVWPAAHALARYLAWRQMPAGWTCLDLGCGTGVAGLAAAALGAKVVALTDLPGALAGARGNVLKNARALGGATVEVCELDWAAPGASRAFAALPSGTACFDVVLAAECVLPKLYPLEPLVACLGAVVGPSTEALVAVELRTWHEFDPKRRFWDLCAERGLRVDAIPQGDLDPAFVADDLEIWRVRRGPARVTGEGIVCARWDAAAVHLEITVASGTYSLETAEKSTVCGRTWPAALAACRAMSQGLWPMKPKARVLELGAGCGVVATYLARRGCAVTATDRATSLPGLTATLLANGVRDQVEVRALDWAAAPASLAPFLGDAYDVILLCDCAYDASLMPDLARTLAALCYAFPEAQFLVANEPRTALDAFLRCLGRFPWCPLLVPQLDALPDLWRVDCLPPHRQPCAAVALYEGNTT